MKRDYKINKECGYIDLANNSCRLVETGEMPMKHKNCNCIDCLVGLYFRQTMELP